jgi:hypothetical protein
MKKFDVWVYTPEEEYLGVYEGYLGEIIAAILTLYPRAQGIYCVPEGEG